jgi:hypothetical protein
MITIQTTISPQQITRSLADDWAPTLRAIAGAIAVPLVAVYVAGLMAGEAWHQVLAWARGQHLQGLSRMGLPGGPMPTIEIPLPTIRVQRQAPVTIPTLTRRSECRRLQAQGLSPAKIGRELGISRSTVRRELAA